MCECQRIEFSCFKRKVEGKELENNWSWEAARWSQSRAGDLQIKTKQTARWRRTKKNGKGRADQQIKIRDRQIWVYFRVERKRKAINFVWVREELHRPQRIALIAASEL